LVHAVDANQLLTAPKFSAVIGKAVNDLTRHLAPNPPTVRRRAGSTEHDSSQVHSLFIFIDVGAKPVRHSFGIVQTGFLMAFVIVLWWREECNPGTDMITRDLVAICTMFTRRSSGGPQAPEVYRPSWGYLLVELRDAARCSGKRCGTGLMQM